MVRRPQLAGALFLAALLAGPAFGETEDTFDAGDTAGETQATTHVATTPQGLIGVSIVTPRQLVLSSPEFEIPFEQNLTGLPTVQLGFTFPLFLAGPLEAQALVSAGYGYKEAVHTVRLRSGEEKRDLIALHRVPAQGALRLLYHVPGMTFMKPTLTLGGGAQWLYQVAEMDGIDKGYWMPFFSVAPALTFFESGASSDWFGGFTFGVSYLSGFETEQRFQAWSFDLSVNVIL